MILNSQRLILRNFKSTDLDDFFYYASQPNVGPNAGWTPHLSKSETKFVLSNFIKNKCEFAIEYNQKVIGSIGYSKDGKRNYSNVYQIGYCLCQDYWGMGLMPEAVECLLEYLFEEIQAELVAVYHFPFNERSKRVILKTGFRYE
ncbi:MAG: GNAT family N-acetyltransferase, partial [Oscillospiraceae bacterium]